MVVAYEVLLSTEPSFNLCLYNIRKMQPAAEGGGMHNYKVAMHVGETK